MAKSFAFMHWWVLLKDQPTWEIFCNQSAKAPSKCLRINDVGVTLRSTHPLAPTLLELLAP